MKKKKELNSFKNLKSLELEEWSTAYPVLGEEVAALISCVVSLA